MKTSEETDLNSKQDRGKGKEPEDKGQISGTIKEKGQYEIKEYRQTTRIIIKDASDKMEMAKEKVVELKQSAIQSPNLASGPLGPNKEILRALEKMEQKGKKGNTDSENPQVLEQVGEQRKNLRKWKRRARSDCGNVYPQGNPNIMMSNEKRKMEDSAQEEEMDSVTKKQCIPYFEVNEGISTEVEIQPRRTP